MKQSPMRLAAGLLATGMISPLSALAVDASYTLRLMIPETALKAALAALQSRREAGFQVAVAVVDRPGQTQVVRRARSPACIHQRRQ